MTNTTIATKGTPTDALAWARGIDPGGPAEKLVLTELAGRTFGRAVWPWVAVAGMRSLREATSTRPWEIDAILERLERDGWIRELDEGDAVDWMRVAMETTHPEEGTWRAWLLRPDADRNDRDLNDRD